MAKYTQDLECLAQKGQNPNYSLKLSRSVLCKRKFWMSSVLVIWEPGERFTRRTPRFTHTGPRRQRAGSLSLPFLMGPLWGSRETDRAGAGYDQADSSPGHTIKKLKRDNSYKALHVETGRFQCVRLNSHSGFKISFVAQHRMCVRVSYSVFK